MESLELSITDVFPMRKRRATGLGDTGRTKNDLNAKLDETKPESCIVKTPVRKLNATSNSSRRKQGRSSVERNEGQRPGKTPTRLNFSPNALGKYFHRKERTVYDNLLSVDDVIQHLLYSYFYVNVVCITAYCCKDQIRILSTPCALEASQQ